MPRTPWWQRCRSGPPRCLHAHRSVDGWRRKHVAGAAVRLFPGHEHPCDAVTPGTPETNSVPCLGTRTPASVRGVSHAHNSPHHRTMHVGARRPSPGRLRREPTPHVFVCAAGDAACYCPCHRRNDIDASIVRVCVRTSAARVRDSGCAIPKRPCALACIALRVQAGQHVKSRTIQ